MKIGNEKIENTMVETLVIPWGGKDLVFKARPILSTDEYDKMCPMPEPRVRSTPKGEVTRLIEEPEYREKFEEWASNRVNWTFIKSLQATDDLVWETVDLNDPSTFGNFRKELEDTFPLAIVLRIIDLVATACGLNQEKIDEATKRFLAGQ